jgi:alpha-galactosidase/6-phospho-beta-glucosidase family protein
VARIQTGVKVTPVWIMDIDKGKSQVMIQKKKLSYTYALVNFEITTRFENNNVSVKFIIFVFAPGKSSAVRTGV